MKKFTFAILSLLAGTVLTAAQSELQKEINAQIAAGKKVVKLTRPEYRSAKTIELRKLDGVTIDGNGAKLVMTRPVHALRLNGCRNTTVKNLTIDYDPLPFTQGVITAVSPDK